MKLKTPLFQNSFLFRPICFLYILFFAVFIAYPIRSASAQSSELKSPEDNIRRQLDKVDLAPRVLDSDFHNEFWTYHFYMDNGMQLILRFSVANFGMARDPVSGAKISIINLPGTAKSFDASKQYPYKELSYDTATSHLQLKEGKEVWFKGDINEQHLVKFDTNKDGNSYDVELSLFGAQPGFQPTAGAGNQNPANTAAPNKNISVMVHIPYAKTRGYVTINDQKYEVTGTAYMDHIYLSKGVAELFKSGLRLIHHQSDTSWVAGYVAETKDMDNYPLIGYLMQRPNSRKQKILLPLNKTARGSGSIDGRSYPDTIDLTFSEQTRYSMTLSEVYQSLSILEDVGGLKKFVAKQYLGGEVINFRGKGLVNGDQEAYFNYFKVN